MMNAKQLRNILFRVDNQQLTVAQLRYILFDIDDQEAELGPMFDRITLEKAEAAGRKRNIQVTA